MKKQKPEAQVPQHTQRVPDGAWRTKEVIAPSGKKRSRPSKSDRASARKNPTPPPSPVRLNPNIQTAQHFRASDTGRGINGYGPGSGPMRADGSWWV